MICHPPDAEGKKLASLAALRAKVMD